MINVKWLMGFEDLTEVHKIRQEVFIVEQKIPYELEFDDTDADAIHMLILDDDIPIGTGRIILIDDEYTLDRIAILQEHRNKGYGKELINHLIRRIYRIGGERQMVHAQLDIVPFFEKHGFTKVGDVFKEAKKEHIKMRRKGDVASE